MLHHINPVLVTATATEKHERGIVLLMVHFVCVYSVHKQVYLQIESNMYISWSKFCNFLLFTNTVQLNMVYKKGTLVEDNY